MKQLFWGAFATCLLWSCSETPDARVRTADCYVRYLKPESQVFSEVVLRTETPGEAGTKSVEASEGVRYRGILMRSLNLQGVTTYRLEQPGGYAPEHTFEWKAEHQQHTFQMNLPPIFAFSFDSDTLSHKKPATLTWEGAPLGKGENIVLIWENITQGLTVPMEIIGYPGQDRIEFPAAQLTKLTPGTWTLYLVRKKSNQTTANGINLRGIAEYYTDLDTVTVVPF